MYLSDNVLLMEFIFSNRSTSYNFNEISISILAIILLKINFCEGTTPLQRLQFKIFIKKYFDERVRLLYACKIIPSKILLCRHSYRILTFNTCNNTYFAKSFIPIKIVITQSKLEEFCAPVQIQLQHVLH